jgi:hypothetical protein
VNSADPAEGEPYAAALSGQARRNIREHLPFDVAAAAMETIDEAKRLVEIHSIRHRRDAYRF